ncbi:hypothetical protein ACGFYP_01250 [Streptomyces sp. NPDC048370]|uniref:hypothetical protein n=1 Tax=Streptomyces sp. NPDC048370 TaxID=3365540 RepID=UPI00371795C8
MDVPLTPADAAALLLGRPGATPRQPPLGIAAHRIPLRRDLLLVVTADEEAGSRLGAYWLWENHHGLLEAEFAFNEGGGQRFLTPGGPVHTVQVAEKGSARMRITARGQGGHASVPRSDAAVLTLAEALLRLRAFAPRSVLHPTARRMLGTLADLHPGTGAQAIERLLKAPTWAAANSLPIDPVLREFERTRAHPAGGRLGGRPAVPGLNPTVGAGPHRRIAGLPGGGVSTPELLHAHEEFLVLSVIEGAARRSRRCRWTRRPPSGRSAVSSTTAVPTAGGRKATAEASRSGG